MIEEEALLHPLTAAFGPLAPLAKCPLLGKTGLMGSLSQARALPLSAPFKQAKNEWRSFLVRMLELCFRTLHSDALALFARWQEFNPGLAERLFYRGNRAHA